MSDREFSEMTLEELRAERKRWDDLVAGGTDGGAYVIVATEFRNQCDAWIRRREEERDG